MAKKSFKKNAQHSLGGFAILQNTTKKAEEKKSEEKKVEEVSKESEIDQGVETKLHEDTKKESRGEAEKELSPVSKKTKPASRRKKKQAELPASEKGCKDGDTRKTFIIRKELAEKMMDIAYWEPGKLKDHMNAALEAYVNKKWTKKRPKGA